MSAREMFEELGYIGYEEHDDTGDYIKYYNEEYDNINFYCDSKTFSIGEYCLCGMKLLKAINKQCEELGWNK